MNRMVYRKSSEELAIMRRAGGILRAVIDRLVEAVAPGVTTAELDDYAGELMRAAGARSSSKGHKGFPGEICTSPNDVVVHGIPGAFRLSVGDILSLDVALSLEGLHVDSARTVPVGSIDDDAADLIRTTERSLDAAIAQCLPGRRLGDVGQAAQQVIEAGGFSVVRGYSGHGVGRSMHEDPSVPNHGPAGRGQPLRPGMTLAIEPMVAAGSGTTHVLADGWSIVTDDGSLAAHFEHTVAITPLGYEVLTAPQRGSAAA
jgi:methionyl aminopeptidase